jgi:hypothetical protein
VALQSRITSDASRMSSDRYRGRSKRDPNVDDILISELSVSLSRTLVYSKGHQLVPGAFVQSRCVVHSGEGQINNLQLLSNSICRQSERSLRKSVCYQNRPTADGEVSRSARSRAYKTKTTPEHERLPQSRVSQGAIRVSIQ